MSEFNINYKNDDDKISISEANEVLQQLNSLKTKEGIEFVFGKGKRKSKLQKFTEELLQFIHKQSKYDNYSSIFNERNSFSKT